MRKLFALCMVLLFLTPAFAATPNVPTLVWDVHISGGNDTTNGGGFDPSATLPGTDESQGGSGTAITCTLTGSGTTATCVPAITSTTHGPGNLINIASGTGCTVGTFDILSQTAGTATFDRSMGSSTDVCVGVIGGSLATIPQAITNSTGGNQIFVQKGTYTITSALTTSTGQCLAFIGYNSTHGDFTSASQATIEANRPLITTSTNSIHLIDLGANCGGSYTEVLQYLKLTSTAGTPSYGICPSTSANHHLILDEVYMSGFTEALAGDNSTCYSFLNVIARRSEFTANTQNVIYNHSGDIFVLDSYIHDNNTTGATIYLDTSPNNITLIGNLFTNNTPGNSSQGSFSTILANSSNTSIISRNNVYFGTVGASSSVIFLGNVSHNLDSENDIFYSNAHYAVNNSICSPTVLLLNSAFGANGFNFNTGCYVLSQANSVTLSATPFTNSGTGDYSLNATAGGGALLKATGWPGVFPSQGSTSYYSIGAVQPNPSGSGSANGPYGYVQ